MELGDGPIERLWYAVEEGLLASEAAREMAATPEILAELSFAYVAALSRFCLRDAIGESGPEGPSGASGSYQRAELVQAAERYGEALRIYVELRLPQHSRDCLELLDDLARDATPPLAIEVVQQAAPLTWGPVLLDGGMGRRHAGLDPRQGRSPWTLSLSGTSCRSFASATGCWGRGPSGVSGKGWPPPWQHCPGT